LAVGFECSRAFHPILSKVGIGNSRAVSIRVFQLFYLQQDYDTWGFSILFIGRRIWAFLTCSFAVGLGYLWIFPYCLFAIGFGLLTCPLAVGL
jgi:hypothetical protein